MDEEPPRPRPLSSFLSGSVALGAVRVPALLVAAFALGGAFAAGWAIGGGRAEPPAPPAALASVSPSASSIESAPLPPAPVDSPSASSSAGPTAHDAIDRARLKALEHRPARERSIDESAELARGHERLGLLDVEALDADFGANKPFDLRRLARLRDIARDDALAIDALVVVARHPSREHADLLYDVRTDPHAADSVRYLAEDLLAVPAVRKEASKELVVALDLAAARGCEAVRLVVERAKSSGDERALPGLRALDDKSGCGRKRDEDCYPCLRDSTLLFEAHEAAAGRAFMPPWRLGKNGQ